MGAQTSGGERCTRLRSEHEGRLRLLLALEPPQGAQLVPKDGVRHLRLTSCACGLTRYAHRASSLRHAIPTFAEAYSRKGNAMVSTIGRKAIVEG